MQAHTLSIILTYFRSRNPDDPDTVERFELYIGGFEVANAFSELNDPVEQKAALEIQLTDRAR